MPTALLGVGCGLDRRLGVGRGEANADRLLPLAFFAAHPAPEVLGAWAGGSHSMVLTRTALLAFGENSRGQLGVGTTGAVAVPTPVEGIAAGDVAQVSLGGDHSLVLTRDGTLYAFGCNASGQLGTGGDDDEKRPKKVELGGSGGVDADGRARLSPVKKISAGGRHSVALTEDGTVYAWGLGDNGQLGFTGDLWDELAAKQSRIRTQVGDRARRDSMGACCAAGLPAAAAQPPQQQPPSSCAEDGVVLESGVYNPHLHPSRHTRPSVELFPSFFHGRPQAVELPAGVATPVADIEAGYLATVMTGADGGVHVCGARPGVMRETRSDAVPTRVAAPAEGMSVMRLLPMRELRVLLCATVAAASAATCEEDTGASLSVWVQRDSDSGYEAVPGLGALPPGTRLFGAERSVAVLRPGAEELVTFGDDFFGQLGHRSGGGGVDGGRGGVLFEGDAEDLVAPAVCALPPPLPSERRGVVREIRGVAPGWRHLIVTVESITSVVDSSGEDPVSP